MAADLSQLSDEELMAIVNQPEQGAPAQSGGLVDTVMRPISAFGANVVSGLETASVQPGFLLRDFTDKLGITDPEATAKAREFYKQNQEEATQYAKDVGHPVLGTVGRVTGEMAPTFAIGSAAFSGAKALLGAGRAADLGASAISGATTAGIQDTGGDLAERARNAYSGAASGAALAGAFQAGSGILAKIQGGKAAIDPAKAEMFRILNVKPRASQLIDKTLSPKVKDFWEGLETDLNKFPGLGIRGHVKTAAIRSYNMANKIIDDLDDAVPDGASLFKQVGEKVLANGNPAFALKGVQRVVEREYNRIANSKGLLRREAILSDLEQLKDVKNLTFQELHDSRRFLDSSINALKKNLGDVTNAEEFRALSRIRSQISTSLDAIARKNGVSKLWKGGNRAYQDRLFIDGIIDARQAALSSGGEVFNMKSFNKALEKNLDFMQNELRLQMPRQYKESITNLKKLSDIFSADKVKPSKGLNLNLQGTMGAMAAGAAGLTYATGVPGAVMSGAILKGLSLMATRPTGLKIIANLGKISPDNPKVRQLAMTALALTYAEDEKGSAEQKQSYLSNLSDEDLAQIVNQPEGGQ